MAAPHHQRAETRAAAAGRWAALVLVLLAGGCNLVPPGTGPPLGYRGELLGRVRVNLLANPRFLGEDYAAPPAGVRQIFAWGPFGSEWRIFVPEAEDRRVGFRFRTPLDFTEPRQNRGAVVFIFYPRSLASRLSLRVTGKDGAYSRAVPLQGRCVWFHGRWGTYVLPVAELDPCPSHPRGEAFWAAVGGLELLWRGRTAGSGGRWLVVRNPEISGVIHSRRLYE